MSETQTTPISENREYHQACYTLNRLMIVSVIEKRGPLSIVELERCMNKPVNSTNDSLRWLKVNGLLTASPGYPVKYTITKHGKNLLAEIRSFL